MKNSMKSYTKRKLKTKGMFLFRTTTREMLPQNVTSQHECFLKGKKKIRIGLEMSYLSVLVHQSTTGHLSDMALPAWSPCCSSCWAWAPGETKSTESNSLTACSWGLWYSWLSITCRAFLNHSFPKAIGEMRAVWKSLLNSRHLEETCCFPQPNIASCLLQGRRSDTQERIAELIIGNDAIKVRCNCISKVMLYDGIKALSLLNSDSLTALKKGKGTQQPSK